MKERLTGLARTLRRQETDAEQTLWRELRGRQMDGWKFKRQVPHGHYILDFFCTDAALVIEVDGAQHLEDRAAYDTERTAYLEQEGFQVLRFWNSDVLDNINGVLEAIYLALGQSPAPSPGALRRQKPMTTPSATRRPLPEGRGKDVAAEKEKNK
jgi:very-short-patch-repair endonuclease